MKLDTEEALKIHIEGLQATLTKRNARIAELEDKLAKPIDLPENIQKLVQKAYRKGWRDASLKIKDASKEAVRALDTFDRQAYQVFLEGEKL